MSSSTESKFAMLAAGQWGMLTAAQISSAGIARSTLLRREQTGAIERVRTGVYRLSGVPSDPMSDLRAAWLATNPAVVARDRRDHPDAVIGGAAAATSHGIGDLYPSPYLLYTTVRRRTRHDDVRYSTRSLPESDVMVLDGLPVTTRERTIADLLGEPGADVTLVAGALRDALMNADDLDVASLIRHLDPHAGKLGHTSGAALFEHLRTLTRVDAVRFRDLLENTDIEARVNAAVEARLQEMLLPYQGQIDPRTRSSADSPPERMLPSKASCWQVSLPADLLPEITLRASTRDLFDRMARAATAHRASSSDTGELSDVVVDRNAERDVE